MVSSGTLQVPAALSQPLLDASDSSSCSAARVLGPSCWASKVRRMACISANVIAHVSRPLELTPMGLLRLEEAMSNAVVEARIVIAPHKYTRSARSDSCLQTGQRLNLCTHVPHYACLHGCRHQTSAIPLKQMRHSGPLCSFMSTPLFTPLLSSSQVVMRLSSGSVFR